MGTTRIHLIVATLCLTLAGPGTAQSASKHQKLYDSLAQPMKPGDTGKAQQILRQIETASRNDAPEAHNLAVVYDVLAASFDLPGAPAKACEWYVRSATLGHAPAYLGAMVCDYKASPLDRVAAFELVMVPWLRRLQAATEASADERALASSALADWDQARRNADRGAASIANLTQLLRADTPSPSKDANASTKPLQAFVCQVHCEGGKVLYRASATSKFELAKSIDRNGNLICEMQGKPRASRIRFAPDQCSPE